MNHKFGYHMLCTQIYNGLIEATFAWTVSSTKSQ
jgi:hypothetical protein